MSMKYTVAIHVVVSLSSMALLSGCAGLRDMAQNVPGVRQVAEQTSGIRIEMDPPVLVAMSDRPKAHGDHAFGQLRQMQDGTIVMFWSTEADTGHVSIESGKEHVTKDRNGLLLCPTSPAITTNKGQTWESYLPDAFGGIDTKQFPIYRRFNPGSFDPVLVDGWTQMTNGSIYAFDRKICMFTQEVRENSEYNAVGVGAIMHPDGAVEYFQSLFKVKDLDRTFGGGEALRVMPRGFQMPDGSIVLVCNPKGTVVPYKYECECDGDISQLYRSVDGGAHFELYATIATPRNAPAGSVDGASEPTVARLQDGSFVAAMRTSGMGAGARIPISGPLMMARSDATGTNWTTWIPAMKGVQPCLLQLQNGVLVLSSGRPGTYISFSTDEGRTWTNTKYLTPASQPSSSYTDMIEIEPNKVLIVYDIREFEPPGEKLLHPSQGYNAVFSRAITVHRD